MAASKEHFQPSYISNLESDDSNLPQTVSMNLTGANNFSTMLSPNLSPDNPEDDDQYTLDPNEIDTFQRPRSIAPMGTVRQSNCLLGTDPCSPLCSGDGQNPCNIVAPIPSPAWQVQTAEAVQNSLAQGQFTASSCLA
jgi:hypothetical protein